MSPIRLALLCCILAPLLLGCGTTRGFESPYPHDEAGAPGRGPSLEEVRTIVESRSPFHATLQTKGDVTVEDPASGESNFFDAVILYRDPGDVRLRGSRVPIGTLFEVLLSGEQAWVALNRDDALFEGTRAELQEQGGLLGSFTPRDLMSVLLVSQDLRRRLAEPGEWRVIRQQGATVASLEPGDGRTIIWRIRAEDGLVSERIELDRGGREVVRVAYWAYELCGDGEEPLPSVAEIAVRGGQLRLTVELDSYILDPELQPQVFSGKFPKGFERHPLRDLAGRGGPSR